MNETRFIAIIVAATLSATACGKATPTAPPGLNAAAPVPLEKNVGDSCSVDVGPTQYPLNAVHGMEGFLNVSLQDPGSSVNCAEGWHDAAERREDGLGEAKAPADPF